MLAIACQTTEPNWLIFFREPTGTLGRVTWATKFEKKFSKL